MSVRVLCKFTHDMSLMAEGERFWIIGTPTSEWFDLTNYEAAPNPIVSAVNLDEGLVHILTEHGSMYEVRANAETTFTIAKVRN